jgi:hypothetical protein
VRIPSLAPLLSSFVCVAAWANETPTYTPLSAEQATELLDGEIIVDLQRGDPSRAETLALIHAPMRELGEIIADFDTATEWAPALTEQYTVERDGDAYILQTTTAIPWPIADRHFRTRATWEFTTVDGHEAFVNAFEYIEGSGNLDETYGYWLLIPYPDDPEYTYAKYVVYADPGIAVPEFLVRWVTRNALPDVIRALAERHAIGD